MKLGNYQLACQRHFDAVHPNWRSFKLSNAESAANHPNQWFAASVEFHKALSGGGKSSSSSSSEGTTATATATAGTALEESTTMPISSGGNEAEIFAVTMSVDE